MAKEIINVGTTANDSQGDSLRAAFTKINTNFTELYSALGLDTAPLNLGAFEFTGSTLSTTDNTSIVIDQATTISSNLTLGGNIIYPNDVLQTTTGGIQCLANVGTVVYTSTGPSQHTIKLLVQVEGRETVSTWDTQSCEIIVAKSFRGNDVAASVYAIVHTSVSPLATFTADWNMTTSRVEVICTPASNTYSVSVRAFATEIITSD